MSLRCFRTALIGPTQGLPKRRRLRRQVSPRARECGIMKKVCLCVQMRGGCDRGGGGEGAPDALAVGAVPSLPSLARASLRVAGTRVCATHLLVVVVGSCASLSTIYHFFYFIFSFLFCVFSMLSLKRCKCSSHIFLSSEPRVRLSTAYITGYHGNGCP